MSELHVIGVVVALLNMAMAAYKKNWDATVGWFVAVLLFADSI